MFGESATNQLVTGGFDDWEGMGGLRVRFQGATMNTSDVWEIEAFTGEIESSNTATNSIQLSRN